MFTRIMTIKQDGLSIISASAPLRQEWTRIELLDNKTDLNKNTLMTRLKIRHLLSEIS